MVELSLEQAFERAEYHVEKGEVAEARKFYQAILTAVPNNERALTALTALYKVQASTDMQSPPQGIINQLLNLYDSGNLEAVIEQANLFTEQYPKVFVFWNILGAVNRGLGDLEEASQAFKKVTELSPTYADGHNNYGITLKEQGRLEEAIEAFEKAMFLKPDYAEAYFNMGITLQEKSKLEEAIEVYEKALAINPDYVDAYNNMGVSLKDQGKLEEAIEAYEKALAIKPDYVDAYYNMGNALKDQGKLEKAIEAYEKALAIKPDYVAAYNNMGNVLKNQGKLEEAIEAYAKVLLLVPDNAEAAGNLVKLPIGSIDEQTISELNKKLSLIYANIDDQSQKLFFKANLFSHKGMYDEAFKTFVDANFLKSKESILSVKSARKQYDAAITRISRWSVNLQSEKKAPVKKLFLLGPSRSGKSTLEKLLIGSPNVYPMLENINLNALDEMKNSAKEFKKPSVKDLFYHDEEYLFKLGYDVLTSTKPESMFSIDHLIDTFGNVFCIYVKRNRIDIASEIFTSEYNEGNFYSYNHSSISEYLDYYEAIWKILKEKVPQLTLEIPIENILIKPQEVVDKISNLTNVSFQLYNMQNYSITNMATPYREYYASHFVTS